MADLEIEQFPKLRLYKQGGEVIDYKKGFKSHKIIDFLKKNGINWNELLKEWKKSLKKKEYIYKII